MGWLATRAEVMRRAISVYSVLVETRKDGKHIELVGPKRTMRERLIIA